MASNDVLTYRYRIYPNKAQIASLSHIFAFCRDLYNAALQERRSHFEKFKKGISYAHQAKELLEIKQDFKTEVKCVYSQVLQSTLKRVDVAFANFFRWVKRKKAKCGFPRFKSKQHFKSILFPQCDFGGAGGVKLLDEKHIRIFGVDNPVRIKMHRPFLGRCKTVAIKRESGDKFYVVLTCVEVPSALHAPTGKTTALDLGLMSFITTDAGVKITHPKPYRTAKEKLKHKQQKLAAKQRGSNNRKRAKLELAKQHEKISNIRKDFLHKTAKQLVDQNDILIVEDLDVKNILESNASGVARNANIEDASFATFVAILEYKAVRAGISLIKVDPRNTSKTCSHCGNIKQNLRLEDRIFHCETCDFAMDRDQNAALNILRLGMSRVKTEASMLSV